MVKTNKKQIIMKVWKNNGNEQLLVTIPKYSEINEGDYVNITKIKNEK